MTSETDSSRIAASLDQITDLCRENPGSRELALVNLRSLLDVMRAYERAPRMYNVQLEDAQPTPRHPVRSLPVLRPEPYKYPVVGNLEAEFRRKLKQRDLVKIAKQLTAITGLKLVREQKRRKDELLSWFDSNWQVLEPRIREVRDSIQFSDAP
jgi:hypothetical protein